MNDKLKLTVATVIGTLQAGAATLGELVLACTEQEGFESVVEKLHEANAAIADGITALEEIVPPVGDEHSDDDEGEEDVGTTEGEAEATKSGDEQG